MLSRCQMVSFNKAINNLEKEQHNYCGEMCGKLK